MSGPIPSEEFCRNELRQEAHRRYVETVMAAWTVYQKDLTFANTCTVYPERFRRGGTWALLGWVER